MAKTLQRATPRKRSPPSRSADLAAISSGLMPLAVSVEQAAQMLHVHRATLYKLVMRGEIESFRVGRARRIAVKALEAFVNGPPGGGGSMGA